MTTLKRIGVVLFLILPAACPVWADTPKPAPPSPALPSPALYMYGYSDTQMQRPQIAALWTKAFETFNIIEGVTTDADFVKRLRAEGKPFAHHVVNTFDDDATVDDIVEAWSVPFRDDLGGKLPGGFDAIAVDELHSTPDGTPASKRVVAALRRLRERYPNKLILVSAVWKLGFSGHKRRNGTLYDEQLKAVNECADLLFLESYHSEVNPQLYLFDQMAKNVDARVPGLLKKTIFGLGIPQNRPFPYGDCSPYVEFGDFLDAQLHRIKNSPLTRDMPGIGYWVFYRARPETVIHTTNLTDHYYLKGRTDFYGDGDYSNRVANPGFEDAGGWKKDPTTSIVPYTEVTDLPNYHAAKFASHEKKVARMVRGPKPGHLTQVVDVEPNTAYRLSAWAAGGDAKTPFSAGLRVADARGPAHFGASTDLGHIAPEGSGAKRWQRLSLTFTTPADTRKVEITLHDAIAKPGAVLYWDFVELEKSYE